MESRTAASGEHRFFIRGDVDMANAPAIEVDLGELISTTSGDIVVDLCGLTFIDSSGLAVLHRAQRTLNDLGRTLRITNVDRRAERTIEVIGLGHLLSQRVLHEGTVRVECSCGTLLRVFCLPFGDARGTFRARCRGCATQWTIPISVVLPDTELAHDATVRLTPEYARRNGDGVRVRA